MSKKLTIEMDKAQYDWVKRNGNGAHVIRELIDADMKKYLNSEITFKNGGKISYHKEENFADIPKDKVMTAIEDSQLFKDIEAERLKSKEAESE